MYSASDFSLIVTSLVIFCTCYIQSEDEAEWKLNAKMMQFDGEEYWTREHRELCDDPEKDETWIYADSLCYTYHVGFEFVHIEIFSWSPPLLVYREFFTSSQVNNYRSLIKKQHLTEQQLINSNGDSISTKYRQANGTYTPADHYPSAQNLVDTASRLIPVLDFNNAEDMTSLTYSPGGHVALHSDFLQYERQNDLEEVEQSYGYRLATFIMVFEKAIMGGGTAFPSLDTVVHSQVGDAILWFNTRRNGEIEELMDHAGCPVYVGQKVISTIWICSKGQSLVEHCTEDDMFHVEELLPGYLI